jgi:hypothetical protein
MVIYISNIIYLIKIIDQILAKSDKNKLSKLSLQ